MVIRRSISRNAAFADKESGTWVAMLEPIRKYDLIVNETMTHPHANPTILAIAERLLAYEAATRDASESDMPAGGLVCKKLGDPLGKLLGSEGFRAILRRALTLARRENGGLNEVELTADGGLEGLNGHNESVSIVLVANLIGLVFTFLGEKLTLKLVQDVWPEEAEIDRHAGERSEHERRQ